ncbi:OmpA family protein [bacterium]|nr:OmpA family protein [bacterium]
MQNGKPKSLLVCTVIFIILLSLNGIVKGATPPGTVIMNRAIFSYQNTEARIFDTLYAEVMITIESLFQAEIEIRAALDTICPGEGDTLLYVSPAETVHYFILFQNTGNDTLFDIIVGDTLSQYSTFISAAPPPDDSSLVLVWNIDTLLPGFADTFMVSAVLDGGLLAGTQIINIASFDSPQLDSAIADTSILLIREVHRMLFNKEFLFPEVFGGSRTAFQLVVQNTGNLDETELIIVDTLPDWVDLRYAASGYYARLDDSLSNDTVLVWQAQYLPIMGIDTLMVTVEIDSAYCNLYFHNEAYLWSEQLDTHRASDSLYVKCVPRISFEKIADKEIVYLEDTLYYDIVIENVGDSVETGFSIVDSLPILFEFLDGSGVYDILTGALSWEIDTLLPGVPETLSFSGYFPDSMPPGSYDIYNWAYLYWEFEEDSSLFIKSVAETVQFVSPFLKVTKKAMKEKAEVGDIVTYVLKVENASSGDMLQGLRLYDKLPLGFKHLSGTTFLNGDEYENPEKEGRSIYWDLGVVCPGQIAVMTYQTVAGWGAEDGDGWNEAYAQGYINGKSTIRSPTVRAHVKIVKGLFSGGEMIIGKVWIDNNMNGYQDFFEEGVPEITIFTEDGMRVVTDQDGKYSIPEIKPGTHVLRLDNESLPDELSPTVITTQQALNPYSSFVDVPKYGMARANFALSYTKHFVKKEAWVSPRLFCVKDVDPKSFTLEAESIEGSETLTTIYFLSGSVGLTETARRKLLDLIPTLEKIAGVMLMIEGHTDSIPMRPGARYKDNMLLSEERAKSVLAFILQHSNLNPDDFEVVGWGDTNPAASNATPYGRAQNRRVNIVTRNITKQVMKSEEQKATVSIRFSYSGKQTVKSINIKEKFIGLDYIQNSARIQGKVIPNLGSEKEPEWQLIGYKGPFDIIVSFDVKLSGSYYSKAPRAISNIVFDFISGENIDFSVSKPIMLKHPTPYTQVKIDDSRFPPAIFTEILKDAVPSEGTSFQISKGDEIIYRITLNVTGDEYYRVINVFDEITKPVLYVENSGVIDGSVAMKPVFEQNKLIWVLPPRMAPFFTTIEYRVIAKTDFQEKSPTGKVWLKIETDEY